MSVLRHIASWVYRGWGHTFRRLKGPGHQLQKQLRQKVDPNTASVPSPWLEKAFQFLLIDGATEPVSKRSGKVSRPASRQSTGQVLLESSLGRSRRTWTVTLLVVVLMATCFGQRFYRQPTLDVRSVAPQTFYAPASAVVEDKKATEVRREDVRSGSAQVLKIDEEQTAAARKTLNTLLQQGKSLREQAGRPNFLNLDTLSKPTQDFLFRASATEWQDTWQLAKTPALTAAWMASDGNLTIENPTTENPTTENPATDASVPAATVASPEIAAESAEADPTTDESATPPPITAPSSGVAQQVRSLPKEQQNALLALLVYRENNDISELEKLQLRVDTRRKQYLQAYEKLVTAASAKNQPLYNYRLFELSESQWQTLESGTQQIFEEMMLQGVNIGFPDDLLRRAIEVRVRDEPSPEVRQLTSDVLAAAIAPNLIPDDEGTRRRAEQAVRQIDPVMVSVEGGDLVVRADEVITSSDFALLDHFGLTNRYFNWIGLSGFTVLMGLAVALYLWIDHQQLNQLNQRDHCLVIVLCLVVSVLAALRVPTLGLPAVGLLVGSFYGSMLGLTVVGLLTIMLPIGTAVSPIPLLAGSAAAMLGAFIAPQLRSREEFALLGGFVGLSQAGVHLVLTLMRFTIGVPLWKAVFVDSALYGLYGIAWSVVALGVSPYLEHFFDVVTPIRLAELANPNRPLLKRLSAEAPGTFQHTMFVANLAEAAARALGRNVELVRAGTLYHDIGKMHMPTGFIENQMGGPNIHDEIDDPWKSACIIKKHVTQGLVMARKYRLPKAVQAFIPEHQGDMKISYFYQQAKAMQDKEPSLVVNAADFSYDGPRPQSPETGITMVADSCEAALRSLKPDASMDEAYTMVNKILRARWRSRQLVDSGLSRNDMDTIASVFIQVWQQHNHKRIEYPQSTLAEQEAM
ncbi:MAG: HDIG domain-containing metalloprotein [Cyanobacteria bacterium J06621_3]